MFVFEYCCMAAMRQNFVCCLKVGCRIVCLCDVSLGYICEEGKHRFAKFAFSSYVNVFLCLQASVCLQVSKNKEGALNNLERGTKKNIFQGSKDYLKIEGTASFLCCYFSEMFDFLVYLNRLSAIK